jgi:hypothetical protein
MWSLSSVRSTHEHESIAARDKASATGEIKVLMSTVLLHPFFLLVTD